MPTYGVSEEPTRFQAFDSKVGEVVEFEPCKKVFWPSDAIDESCEPPSLSDIIEVARKEFPRIPFDHLHILSYRPAGEKYNTVAICHNWRKRVS